LAPPRFLRDHPNVASIRERPRSDGTVAYVVLWRTGGRGSPQPQLTFDDRPAAERARHIIELTRADPERIAELLAASTPDRTVRDAVHIHVEALTGVSSRTRADYLRDSRRYIEPVLGALPVTALDRDTAAGWLNRLDGWVPRISDKTIANLHGLLSAAMGSAAERGWVERNPCRGLRLPARDYGDEQMVILTHAEWTLLLGEIPPYWQPLYTFLAGTGVRWAEAAGLTVAHLDLDAEQPAVRIVQSDKRGAPGSGRRLGSPKSRRSRRTVTLPEPVAVALAPVVAGRGPAERVFTTRRGGPLNRSHYGQVWQPAVARARDPDRHGAAALARGPRIHDLRHSHASWLLAAGVDLLTVSRRLGHESITTTADRYGHLLPESQRRAAEAAARALGGGSPVG
jgi:integrase